MDDILAQAARLATLLAGHPRTVRLRALEEQVLADPSLRTLMEDYEQATLTLAHAQTTGQPIDPTFTAEAQAVRSRVHAEPILLNLAHAQADFAELTGRVNQIIAAALKPEGKGGL